MRVTACGVNSAFARGKPVKAISADVVKNTLADWQLGKIHLEEAIKTIHDAEKTYYDPKWQSNFLLEFDCPGKIKPHIFRMMIDFGGDIRHSLSCLGLTVNDIDAWYCSHPHADHIGGVEGIALSSFFNPFYNEEKKKWSGGGAHLFDNANEIPPEAKPDLQGHGTVLREIWRAAAPGLETLQGVMDVRLSTYFNLKQMVDNKLYSIKDGDRTWNFYTVISTHVVSGAKLMPSYGLMFESVEKTPKRIYFPTDTQFMAPPQIETFYRRAHVIYQDCETGYRSGVHSHIDDLKTLSPEIKRKLYLYHYDQEPVVGVDEFLGVLKTGDSHTY